MYFIFQYLMLDQELLAWPMQAPTPTEVSSSFAQLRYLIFFLPVHNFGYETEKCYELYILVNPLILETKSKKQTHVGNLILVSLKINRMF